MAKQVNEPNEDEMEESKLIMKHPAATSEMTKSFCVVRIRIGASTMSIQVYKPFIGYFLFDKMTVVKFFEFHFSVLSIEFSGLKKISETI